MTPADRQMKISQLDARGSWAGIDNILDNNRRFLELIFYFLKLPMSDRATESDNSASIIDFHFQVRSSCI